MRKLILTAVTLLTVTDGHAAAQAKLVLCESPDREDIVIELDAETFQESSLSCVRGGGGFFVDMTPCAPDGGFSLSAPTGSAAIVGVVDRWQDYGDHLGGVVGFGASSSNYWFQGGFMSPSGGYSEQWTFDVSRLTGEGVLRVLQEVEEGGERGYSSDDYICHATEQKF